MGVMQNDVQYMGSTQIVLAALSGTTFPVIVQPPAGCVGMQLKVVAGTTAMILPTQISGASVGGATSLTNVAGYPLPTIGNDLTPIMGPARFYMACGASSTVAINFFFSAGGASLL
jgi:hypothetical protein